MPKDEVTPDIDKDQLTVMRCFEAQAIVKERPLEENPRRHFSDKRRELYADILTALEESGALVDTTEQLKGPGVTAGTCRILVRVWALVPSK
jgi:hypothetical protein